MADPIRCPAGALEIDRDGKSFGTYVATVPADHALDDVLTLEYFGRMQSRSPVDKLLRPGDFIDVRPADFSWYVRLMVRACVPTVDHVITAAIVPATAFSLGDLPEGWTAAYKGVDRKWTVFYNEVEKAAHFTTPEEARAKIDELAAEAPAPRAKAKKPAKEPETV
jgi:hypothetical protein